MLYQSHDGNVSTSNSRRKLERICLPANLYGKAVLDLGCNEGFFCAEAVRRGATRVIGLDNSFDAINIARDKYAALNIEFTVGSWTKLPQEKFDIVLWLSAMHYEFDPAAILRSISECLHPNGMLILECGVFDAVEPQFVPVLRPKDVAWYPTLGLVPHLLADFGFRQISAPELTPGDPVPRIVYHCVRRQPTVILLRGKSNVGKSSLTRKLSPVSTKTLLIDSWLELLSKNNAEPTRLVAYIAANFVKSHIENLCLGIDIAGLTNEYIEMLASGVASSDDLVVIEGYMTDTQSSRLADSLAKRAVVFVTDRVLFPGRLTVNLQNPDFVLAQLQHLLEITEAPTNIKKLVQFDAALAASAEPVADAEDAVRGLTNDHAQLNELHESTLAEGNAYLAETATQFAALTDRAIRAETYSKSLFNELENFKHGYASEQTAMDTERSNFRQHADSLTDRAARAENYSQFLLEKIERQDLDQSRSETSLRASLLDAIEKLAVESHHSDNLIQKHQLLFEDLERVTAMHATELLQLATDRANLEAQSQLKIGSLSEEVAKANAYRELPWWKRIQA